VGRHDANEFGVIRGQRNPPICELYDRDADVNDLGNVADHPEYADDRSALEAALDRVLAS
jgi:hypothetical protein